MIRLVYPAFQAELNHKLTSYPNKTVSPSVSLISSNLVVKTTLSLSEMCYISTIQNVLKLYGYFKRFTCERFIFKL